MGAWAAFVAAWRAMLRDPAALLLLFGASTVYAFFYPLPYGHETVRRVPVVVVDADASSLSRQLTRMAAASPAVRVVAVVRAPDEAQPWLWRQDAAAVLLIPRDFQTRVLQGRPAEVQLAGNGSYLMLNRTAVTGLAQAAGTLSAGVELKRLAAGTPSATQAAAQREPVPLVSLPLFNVREGYGAYVVPAAAVLIIQQTLLMAVALMLGSWVQRREQPVAHTLPGYLGLWLALAAVPLLNSLFYLGFVFWWQGYPRAGHFGPVLAFTLLFALTVAAVAVLIGTAFRTRERSAQVLLATSMPILFLSGALWPASSLPEPLALLRWLSPSTAGIQGLLALNQMGASLAEVRQELLALLALLLPSVGWGAWRWVRREPVGRAA